MILAGTGHRPDKLGGYSTGWELSRRDFALDILKWLSPDHVISGMALGWDQALAWACIALDIPFTAAIPFEGQESMWPESSQKTWRTYVAKASVVHYVCEPGYAAWKMQKRNEWMVDQLSPDHDMVLALWNRTSGGTANCVAYADSRQVEVFNVWDMWTRRIGASD